ncbi:MAG: hypothetical protein IIY18_06895 [Clostridia bacterium]|nr:hypothetical protein [Clostridia bacterium]MBQ5596921.1 hypothetical protein [Clostridia bacterium]
MISMIIGNKGSGKTKRLVELVNAAVDASKGNVVCIEKGLKLTYDLTHKARLVDTDEYNISGFDTLYGFITGMCAGNYDLTEIFVDATLKIGGRNYEELADFMAKLAPLVEKSKVEIVFTISCDEAELPARIFDYANKI